MVANTDQPMAMERQEDSPVMLSAAKHLNAHCNRPFAVAQGDTEKHLRLMLIGAPSRSPVLLDLYWPY